MQLNDQRVRQDIIFFKKAKAFGYLTSCSKGSESYFKSPFLLEAKPYLSFGDVTAQKDGSLGQTNLC